MPQSHLIQRVVHAAPRHGIIRGEISHSNIHTHTYTHKTFQAIKLWLSGLWWAQYNHIVLFCQITPCAVIMVIPNSSTVSCVTEGTLVFQIKSIMSVGNASSYFPMRGQCLGTTENSIRRSTCSFSKRWVSPKSRVIPMPKPNTAYRKHSGPYIYYSNP